MFIKGLNGMIEINFLEKNKRNAAPFVLIFILAISMIGIVTIASIYRASLVNDYQENLVKIRDNEAIIAEIEQNNLIVNQLNRFEQQIDQLEENLYPTVFLEEQVTALLPDLETTQVLDYQFSIRDSLSLRVQLYDKDQVAILERNLVEKDFISTVTLENIVLINETDLLYEASFGLNLDRESLLGVAQNDD